MYRRKMWTVRKMWIVMPMVAILPALGIVLADEPAQRERSVEKQAEDIQSMAPLTAEEFALHDQFADLSPDVYLPRETVVGAADRLGISGAIYSGEFRDDDGFPMFKAELGWTGKTGELAVAITDTNDCQPVVVVDYSDPRRITWHSLDQSAPLVQQYSGWIVAYNDGFALQVSGPKVAYRVIVDAQDVKLDSNAKFEFAATTGARCACRATPPKGTCGVTDCDDSEECTGGPGGQNCVWLTPCY